jgi:hypothetical protein
LALYFKSDIVWLVDFDPVVGFVRSEVSLDSPGEETANVLQSVISSDYATLKTGESAMAQINMDALSVNQKPKQPKAGSMPRSPEITAIRLKGFWREKDGHKEVDALIDRLRNGSKYFNVMPTQQTIIEKPTDLGDAYAARFEIILPLKEPISMEYSEAVSN